MYVFYILKNMLNKQFNVLLISVKEYVCALLIMSETLYKDLLFMHFDVCLMFSHLSFPQSG